MANIIDGGGAGASMVSAVWGGRAFPVTQPFSPGIHDGIDIGCPSGTDIGAARAGYVERVQAGMVSIQVLQPGLAPGNEANLGPLRDFYLHGTPAPGIAVGVWVKQGQWVIVSDTVQVDPRFPLSGPHLHFEVQDGFNLPGAPPSAEGHPLDPVPVLLAALPAPSPVPTPAPGPPPPSNLDQARASWARLGELLITDFPGTVNRIAAAVAKIQKLP